MAKKVPVVLGYLCMMAVAASSACLSARQAAASSRPGQPGTPGDPLVLGCSAEAWAPEPVPQKPRPGDLATGPLIIPGGKRLAGANPSGYGEHGSYKIPVIVKLGATVTVTIGSSARGYVRIENPHSTVGAVTAITYHACAHMAGFFPQSFVFRQGRTRGCVPLMVRTPAAAVRRLEVSLFAGPCPTPGRAA